MGIEYFGFAAWDNELELKLYHVTG